MYMCGFVCGNWAYNGQVNNCLIEFELGVYLLVIVKLKLILSLDGHMQI